MEDSSPFDFAECVSEDALAGKIWVELAKY
jgi:hypothetical protein